MATITSATSGNWSAGGTWVGGIAPVIGDKVIIAHTSTGLNTFSTNTTGYAIGSTNITLTGSVLAGSYVVGESVQFGTDPNYYKITAWNNVTKVLTVDPLIIAIPTSATLVQTRGHVVTVNTTGLGGGDDTTTGITVSGTLRASRTANSLLRSRGNIWKELSGKIDWGSESDPIPPTYTAYIELNDSATQANNKYGFVNNATANNTAGFSFWGAPKTRLTTVSVPALSTDTVITVADASGWVVGDILVFDGTVAEGGLNSHRYRKISAIAGNDVTISANLGYASPNGRKVCNLTSNVQIYGVNGNTYRTQVSIRIPSSQTTADIVEIGETEFKTSGGGTNTYEFGSLSLQYESTQATVRAMKKVYRPIAHHIWDVSGSTVTKLATGGSSWSLFNFFGNQAARYTIDTPIGSSDISGTSLFYWYGGTNTDIVNPIAIRLGSGIAYCGYSQGPVGSTITGGYVSLVSSPVLNTGVKIAVNGLEVDGINNIGNQFAFGSYTWTNCIFGRVFGYLGATNLLAIATGASVPALFDSCTFYTPTVFTRSGTNLNNSTSDTYFKFRNKNNDTTQQEILRRGGRILRDNSTTYRGVSSLAMYSWYSANPLVHTDTVTVQAGQTVRVLGYCRYNTTYGTTYPTTLALSMPNVTTVTYTCPTSGADTWYPIDTTITNSNAYPVTMTLTFTAQSSANTETATAWFDGITVTDFVTTTRHYGFQFTNTVAQTVDSFITQTNEATVGAYTGISINTGTSTITLTSDHSIQEVYDYCKWYLCQTANLSVPEYFTTDGATYTTSYNIVNNSTLSGTGTLITSETYTGSGTTTLVVKDSVGVRCKITSGGSAFAIKGATIAYEADITEKIVTVSPNTDVSFVMWKLGYKPQLFTINSGSLGGTFNISMLDITESVDTGLNVAPIIALTSTTVDMSGYHIFFGEMELSLEQMKAVVHRLMKYENYFDAVLATSDDNVVEVRSDEIRVNKPLFTIERDASLTLADRVQLNGYINISNAVAIDPVYIINPGDSDGLYVTYLTVKPGIDAEYLAGKVWENSNRTLTESVGLTTEEHDRLMSLYNSGGGGFSVNLSGVTGSINNLNNSLTKKIEEEHNKTRTFIETKDSETNSHIEVAKETIITTIGTIETDVDLTTVTEGIGVLKSRFTKLSDWLKTEQKKEMESKDMENKGKLSELQSKIDEMEDAFEEMQNLSKSELDEKQKLIEDMEETAKEIMEELEKEKVVNKEATEKEIKDKLISSLSE